MRQIDEQSLRMVCSISAGMLGVCFTGIGLIRVVITIRHANTIADDLLAVNALLFLFAMLTSYCALRTIGSRRLHRLEAVADGAFLLAMAFLTLNCFVMTYAVSSRGGGHALTAPPRDPRKPGAWA